jgi:integrase
MSGSLREKSPGVWEIRVALGRDPLTGSYRSVSRTIHGGKRKAQEEIARIVSSAANGKFQGTRANVRYLTEHWLEHLERLGRSPKTLEGYRSLIKNGIDPALGSIELAKLSASDIDRFYGLLQKKGLANNTIHHYHACLSAALHQAVRWGWIDHSPTVRATAPSLRPRDVRPPSLEDVRRVLVDLEKRNPELACLVFVATTTGCRRGELCGLRWTDLDLVGGTLTVNRAITETRSNGLVEKDPKTHRSRRIALDPSTIAALESHQRLLDHRSDLTGVPIPADGYVWSPVLDASRPMRPDQVTGHWRRSAKRVGLGPVRFHDLRHFAATVLASSGVDIRTIAGRLGHAHPAITLRTYAHFMEAADRDAAAVMGRLALAPPSTLGGPPEQTVELSA